MNGSNVVQTTTTTALSDTLDLATPGNGDKGDVITVTVTPSDGTNTGTPVSASTTVADSPPVATVTLTPLQPTATQTLVATATTFDADNDPVTLTYVWTDNGTVVQSDTITSLTDALSLSGIAQTGDLIVVTVTPSDGTVSGTPVAAARTVVSPAPTASVILSPSNPTTNQVLTANVTTFDPDGNPVSLSYVWTVNGNIVQTTSNTTALSDTLDLSVPGNGDKGDVIAVTVTPSDQFYTGPAATASTIVADSPPTVMVLLSPINPPANQALTATALAADADNDPVTLTYVWTDNGTVVQTTTSTWNTTDALRPQLSQW